MPAGHCARVARVGGKTRGIPCRRGTALALLGSVARSAAFHAGGTLRSRCSGRWQDPPRHSMPTGHCARVARVGGKIRGIPCRRDTALALLGPVARPASCRKHSERSRNECIRARRFAPGSRRAIENRSPSRIFRLLSRRWRGSSRSGHRLAVLVEQV